MSYRTIPVEYQIRDAQDIINRMSNKGSRGGNYAVVAVATAKGQTALELLWDDNWKVTAPGFTLPTYLRRTVPRAIVKVGSDERPVETQYDYVDCLLAFFGSTVEEFWNTDMDSALVNAHGTLFSVDDELRTHSEQDGRIPVHVPLY